MYGEELTGDFQQFFSLRFGAEWLVSGELDAHHALELVRSLFNIPGSRFAAAFRGDDSLGWDRNSPILADMADMILGLLSGLGSKSISADQMQHRPGAVAEETTVSTIADFDVGGFLRQINT